MNLVLVSSIPCTPSSGGPLQLYRHFKERLDFALTDVTPPCTTLPWAGGMAGFFSKSRGVKRLRSTRLYPWFLVADSLGGARAEARTLLSRVRELAPDALLTVAYGRYCFVAAELSRLSGVPLITIYHDWWPDLLDGMSPASKRVLDRRFRRLAAASDLVLPVSAELLAELGGHPRAVVLPPIPAEVGHQQKSRDPCEGKPLLVYAGTMAGAYGAMIRGLADHLLASEDPPWRFKAYGPVEGWTGEQVAVLTEAGIYGGMLSQGEPLNRALAEADALLVVMDFEPQNRRRVRTSFPSKILDYAPFCKPLVVWGPDECFASRFAREHQLGWVIDRNDPRALTAVVAGGWPSDQAAKFSQSMLALCKGSHSAAEIHRILVHSIRSLPGMTPAVAAGG